MRRPCGLDAISAFCVKRTWRPGLASEQTREIRLPGSRNCMLMQVPAGAEGASAAEGRAANGRCGRRPQHRCERADARNMERAAREHRMRSRCAAGAEGARAAEGRVAPPPPASASPKKLLGTPEWGFQPAVAPPCVCHVDALLASWAFARETLAYFCGKYLQY
jgi:hypothetical protein